MKIIWDIIKTEGGYVNHPNDRGGPTKYGITQRTYSNHLKRDVTIEEVKNITKELAYKIYETNYLIKPKIDKLQNNFLTALVLDMAVNHGSVKAIIILQQTINKVNLFNITADGIIGPNTLKAVNTTYEYIGRYFTNLICNRREEIYINIVNNNESQRVFLKGWLKRARSFKTELPNVFY